MAVLLVGVLEMGVLLCGVYIKPLILGNSQLCRRKTRRTKELPVSWSMHRPDLYHRGSCLSQHLEHATLDNHPDLPKTLD